MYPRNFILTIFVLMTMMSCKDSEKTTEAAALLGDDKATLEVAITESEVIRSFFLENAFSKGLVDPDLRVAYNHAITAVTLNPSEAFANYDKVVPLLSNLIQLTGVRNIYLISNNNNLHNFTRNFCRKYGYVFNGSRNAAVALKELNFSPARDLILLDSGLDVTDAKGEKTDNYFSSKINVSKDVKDSINKDNDKDAPQLAWPPLIKSRVMDYSHPIEALFAREVFLWIKKDVRTNAIPVAILSLNQGSETEIGIDTAKHIYGDKASDYLIKPLSEDSVSTLCETLFHDKDKIEFEDAKLESESLVIKACQAVAELENVKTTIFDVQQLEKALIEAMREPEKGGTAIRPPHLRIEVIKCAAAINIQSSFPYMMAVASNTENVTELRAAAIQGMGKLIGKNNRIVPIGSSYEDVIKSLSTYMTEETDPIWESTAYAFGHLKMTEDTRTALARDHRINKGRKE